MSMPLLRIVKFIGMSLLRFDKISFIPEFSESLGWKLKISEVRLQ